MTRLEDIKSQQLERIGGGFSITIYKGEIASKTISYSAEDLKKIKNNKIKLSEDIESKICL